MVTKYGYDVVFTTIGVVLLGGTGTLFLFESLATKFIILAVLALLLAFTLYFFRDPERSAPEGDNIVLSPADGKLVLIKEIENSEFLETPAIQISIFLSPLNVHVNRIPWSGKVGYYKYVRGKFMVAYDHMASEKNERTEIGIERDGKRILFKQIVGSIARRIVCKLNEGDEVTKGERFGMIKFGSRMDVILPVDAKILIEVGSKVVAGETILAEMPDSKG